MPNFKSSTPLTTFATAALLLAASIVPARAQEGSPAVQMAPIVVDENLDASRAEIAPSLGAVTYTIGSAQIETLPQGESAPFQQVMLRVPGVVQDEFGEVHVRGDHGDLQYRINGILLPEGLNGFGQELDTRLIESVSLVTGTLPAQFGFRTAGIFDVTTKTGSRLDGDEASIYGGSYATFDSSLELGGANMKWEYFASFSTKHDDLGIDPVTPSPQPLHDATSQEKGFAYVSYRPTETSRVTLLLSASDAAFQLPDIAGLAVSYDLSGIQPASASDSADIADNQTERNDYGVLSYQLARGPLSLQVSAFARESGIQFNPDPIRDLLFDGVAGGVKNSDLANGVQVDAALTLNAAHTLRAGLLATEDHERLDSDTAVFPADDTGQQTSDQPFTFADRLGNDGLTAGLYLQDEWHLTDRLTLNYGARYDRFEADFDHEDQLSPRVNLVWQPDEATSLHAGFARYFMPPTLQYVPPSTVREYEGTTNASFNDTDNAQKCERDNYFDVGVSRQIGPTWNFTADSFCKLAKNLLDDGQFGRAVILDNFNYEDGHIYGAELGASSYKRGPLTAYANFSFVYTQAKNVDSAEYQFPADELAYIATHEIRLDHEGEFTGSGGISYTWRQATLLYADALYGNGLRAGFANLEKLPSYHPLSFGLERTFHGRWVFGLRELKLRLECLNVLNEVYELRNGTGLGVAAPAYGPRRGAYAGLTAVF